MDTPDNDLPQFPASPEVPAQPPEQPVEDNANASFLHPDEEADLMQLMEPEATVEAPVKPEEPPLNNAKLEYEIFEPLTDKVTKKVTLPLPNDTNDEMARILEAMPNVALLKSEAGDDWVNVLNEAARVAMRNDYYSETLKRPTANFRQTISSEKGPLGIAAPSFNDDGPKVAGERAVLRVRALTGLGSVVQIPLVHSGFWISLKAPSDAAMLELNRRLAEEKITLGRQAWGMPFSNSTVFFAGWIMDFALNHVYETSCKAGVDWRKHISSLDIPQIAWGLACAQYPRGFPYSRSVLDPEAKEFVVIREKINVTKISWTDVTELTPWQIAHLAQRHGSHMTVEQLERYRTEFTRGRGRRIELDDIISMTLRVPTMDEYLNSGQKWVNNIVAMVDRAMQLPPGDVARDTFITTNGRATNMRQFSHWVESITASGVDYNDPSTIEELIDALSSSDAYRKKYFEEIKKFTEDSMINIIAVPRASKDDVADLPRFPNLLAIDALSVFFTLLAQTVATVEMRE